MIWPLTSFDQAWEDVGAKYGFDTKGLSIRALRRLEVVVSIFDSPSNPLTVNPAVYDREVLESDRWPTASGDLLCFLAWYKRYWPTGVLGRQDAKPAQNLRDNGWLMEERLSRGNHSKDKWTIRTAWEGGPPTDCRRILGPNPNWTKTEKVTADPRAREAFLLGQHCRFCNKTKNLEVEHRIPRMVYLRENTSIPELKFGMSSEEVNRLFQVACTRCNQAKREACIKCLRGEGIQIPCYLMNQWKTQRGNSCEGCYYHNPPPLPLVVRL